MTYAPPVDELLERDVLAGLTCEKYRALELYPVVPADAFAAHRLHPYVFGALRRLHLAGGGSITHETETGPDKRERTVLEIHGFATVFDAAYPKAGAGPALALLRDAIAGAGLLFTTIHVERLLELRERRRLRGVIEGRMRATSDIGELEDLHALAEYVTDPAFGPLEPITPALVGLDIDLVSYTVAA